MGLRFWLWHRAFARAVAYLLIGILCLGAGGIPAAAREKSIYMSHEREEELGRQAAAQVEASMGLVDNPELQAYVDSIGQRLADVAPRQDITYRFHIVNMLEPNAFALPGGYIYVSRGLLALTNSEDELANVIAHEIAHVSAEHAAGREVQQKAAQALSLLGILAGIMMGEGGAVQAAGMFGQSYLAAYGRDQEREADELGQGFAIRAGWDPTGMADFLNQLDDWTRLQMGGSRRAGYFDTHPATPERIATASTRALSLLGHRHIELGELTRREFLRRLDGLIVGDDPAGGVFDGSRFRHADLGFGLRFPRDWELHNTQAAVGAVSPEGGEAIVTLESPGRGTDPERAARAMAEREKIYFHEASPIVIGDLPAYRARWSESRNGKEIAVDCVWIAYGGLIYRIVGLVPTQRYRRYKGTFQSVARSFHALTPKERAKIEAVRLRFAIALRGEDLKAVAVRTKNAWTVHETAVRNGFFADKVFERETPIKVAIAEPYVGKSADGKAAEGNPEAEPAKPEAASEKGEPSPGRD